MAEEAKQDEPFESIKEVAQHFAISTSTVRSWVRSGRIPSDTYFKLGNTYWFRLGAITAALIEGQAQNPVYAPLGGNIPEPPTTETPETEGDALAAIADEFGDADEDI
mgnify:CR=1 FL=1